MVFIGKSRINREIEKIDIRHYHGGGLHALRIVFNKIRIIPLKGGRMSGYRKALPLCKGLLYYYRNPDGKNWQRSSA